MKSHHTLPLRAGLLATALLTTIASAQNVGIGTTTPKSKLSVNGSTATGGIAVGDATYTSTTGTVAPTNGAIIQGNVGINTRTPQSQLDVRGTTKIMATTGTQTGNFWNGTSSVNGFEAVADLGTGDAFVGIQRTTGNAANLHLSKGAGAVVGSSFLSFYVNGGSVGQITYNGSGVTYSTTSDLRLKENIRPSQHGLETVKAVNVYDYNFRSDEKKILSTGVMAQELHKVYPQAVNVGGEDEKTHPWTVDYSKLTPVLIKAVQEQQGEMVALKAEITALKSENEKLKAQAEKFDALAARMEAMEKMVSVPSSKDGSLSLVLAK